MEGHLFLKYSWSYFLRNNSRKKIVLEIGWSLKCNSASLESKTMLLNLTLFCTYTLIRHLPPPDPSAGTEYFGSVAFCS